MTGRCGGLSRDGSVWLRTGRDHAALDWVYVDEPRTQFQTIILTDDDIRLLQVPLPSLFKNRFGPAA